MLSFDETNVASSSTPLITSIMELLYNHNVELCQPRPLPELMHHYNGLLGRLQEWRETISPFGGLVSIPELRDTATGSYDALRLRILLSIHYYRLCAMMSSPIIFGFVKNYVGSVARLQSCQSCSWEEYVRVANADWLAVRELGG